MNKNILMFLLFPIVAVLASYYAYQPAIKSTPKIVTLDTKGMLQDFIVDAAKTDLQGDELDAYVKRYTESLENITKELAEQENLLILPNNAVIAGNIDITSQVEQLIKQGYGKGESK
ncbi:MAG: TrbI F-type domain-containing protein [Proteobacteria bacterium]|nr:TrbI F-type domain-containing protein [Pseudomonadota bacterium]